MKLCSDNVKMVYHPYPNSEEGWRVAEGLEAAGEQGKFWEVQDRLLDTREEGLEAAGEQGKFWEMQGRTLSTGFAGMTQADIDAELMAAAKKAGLDINKFEEALNSPETRSLLETARQEAVSRGVSHPSMYVSGKDWMPGAADDLPSTVDKELAGRGKQ